MWAKMTAWLATMPSTNTTIATGLGLSVLYVLWALLSDSFGRPLGERTLDTIGLFVMGLVTGGVLQFGAKRLTYRNPTPPDGKSPSTPDA